MIRHLFLISLLALTALGAQETRSKEEDNLREVAFKTLIYEAAAAREGYSVYFLSVGLTWKDDNHFTEIDPSDELMKRFVGRNPPVRKVSDSRKADGGRVVDKSTGKPGVIFTVDDLKWISDNAAETRCAVYKAGLNGIVYKYTLSKTNNQWKVTTKELKSVS